MLELLEKGQAVLVASDSYGLPTIHNFHRRDPEKAYHKSIKHLGFGLLRGRTENGEFFFDGGAAMRHADAGKPGEEGYERLSWCPLEAVPEILKDLGYDVDAVKQIVEAKLGSVGPL
jgi:hypothetical protein